ncbi:hypothetical protein [Mesorhizobium sp. B2-3-5]|uniref:hypothetical protein n=1 Tax=Mesorhizobium sp. B2-3-5 TaxID=2589958 RepID=UPI001171631F|nr:hypothetical protein [Mesorhizobium sp. B2-3-5]TPM34909.1 hypothetical protein FJ958_07395 [Mesorhizobium sp. B2-3-5]
MKIPPDLALGGKRFKEELSDTARVGGILVWSGSSLVGFARFAFFSAHRALGRVMFWRSPPSRKCARSLEAPLTAACSCLMGLVLLAMLCLGRPDVPTFADPAQGGVSVGLERSGELAALPRVTNKAQALEVRGARPVLAKFASGHPALPAPQAVFLRFDPTLPAVFIADHGAIGAPSVNSNQPRAPPSTRA